MSSAARTARRTPLLALTAALLVAFAALVAPASAAHAHDELVGTDPAADAQLAALPPQLTLTFSDAIATDAGASVVQVTDAAGTSLVDGAPTAQDNVLTQPLAGEASGVVTVLWKVVSSDGHPISGEFAFTVAAAPEPSATATATPGPSATSPTETVTPTAPPADDEAASGGVWPWLIAGLILAAIVGAVIYLMTSRARREKALAEPATTEFDPSADR